MTRPVVSVILPTFNRSHLLPRAVQSVVDQTITNWELIIVDDGSTDETASVVERYRPVLGNRLVYLRSATGQPAGASASRNRGIDRARGSFLAFLDSDDEFLPTKLERQLSLFRRRPDVALVFSDMAASQIDGTWHDSWFALHGQLIRSVPTEDLGDGQRFCGPDFVDYLVRGYLIPTITGLVRRDVLDDDVRFAPKQSYSEEWLFFLEIARRGRCAFIDQPLSVQYCQKQSVSFSSAAHNIAQQYQALCQIRQRFPRVSADARRAIRDQIVHYCRQLGFDAYKQKRYRQARSHFVEAWSNRPDLRGAAHVLQSLWRQVC